MIASMELHKGQKPTDEQIEEVRNAAERPPVFDEDCPELTLEQLNRYRQAALRKQHLNAVTLELSDADLETAKGFGVEYRTVLSNLLSVAIKDPQLLASVRTAS